MSCMFSAGANIKYVSPFLLDYSKIHLTSVSLHYSVLGIPLYSRPDPTQTEMPSSRLSRFKS